MSGATTCTCDLCRECCRWIPGALLRVDDLERIERATRRPGEPELDWAARVLVASAGAVLGTADGQRREVPNLSLRSAPTGACPHFVGERCAIYADRPAGCSDFDCSMSDEEGARRGLELHQERYASMGREPENDPDGARYWRLFGELQMRGHVRTREELNARVFRNVLYRARRELAQHERQSR